MFFGMFGLGQKGTSERLQLWIKVFFRYNFYFLEKIGLFKKTESYGERKIQREENKFFQTIGEGI